MSDHAAIKFEDLTDVSEHLLTGEVVVFAKPHGKLFKSAKRIDAACHSAVQRCVESPEFDKLENGNAIRMAFPAGISGAAILILKLPKKPDAATARKAGATIAKMTRSSNCWVIGADVNGIDNIAFGASLRSYRFRRHKEQKADDQPSKEFTFFVPRRRDSESRYAKLSAVAEGVHWTRDLVNEPANVLTTDEFASRITGLRDLGVEVKILDEVELQAMGMRALLAVGQGSSSMSRVAVMHWNGGSARRLALVGKGVVFDTGGISMKPAARMEQMTMDMAGAGVVAGVMRTLARRKSTASVTGIVGLVENMPDGTSQRPGDVVRTLKGSTVEVINTDAEGRLVLADLLWYAQEQFKPAAIIDLATLTGAIIVSLGHEMAGAFSNDAALWKKFHAAAMKEGESVWRMPLGQAYDEMLDSRIADFKNVGGRYAGAVTAAQFLQKFIKPGIPWMHLDIAGVASLEKASAFAPKGATGWGVASLNRMICSEWETE